MTASRLRRAALVALPFVACVAVGVTLGVGGFTFVYAEGHAYLSNDPAACVNCHVMREEYDGWSKASHHAVATCNSCHTPHDFVGKWYTKAENGFWHSYGFTFQNFHEPIRIRPRNSRVLENNCIDCHKELTDPITGVPPDPPGGWNCIHCHQNVGHGTPADRPRSLPACPPPSRPYAAASPDPRSTSGSSSRRPPRPPAGCTSGRAFRPASGRPGRRSTASWTSRPAPWTRPNGGRITPGNTTATSGPWTWSGPGTAGTSRPPLPRGVPGREPSKLDLDPRLVTMYAGYPFSTDYREARGHAYMLSDQDVTERTQKFKQPGACLQCHASIIPTYVAKGKEAGVPDSDPHGQLMKGFAEVCKMPLADARKLVEHPVACIDCHDPRSMALRVTRPAFLTGIAELAMSEDPVPHLPSVERWRKGERKKPFDPNADASRQELRSLVCGQCHVEYYFQKDTKLVTYPWHNGLKADQIEAYYDRAGFADWTHPEAGTQVLKAQHPEFEMWGQGIHARSGVSCADCHMPYVREGAIKVSNHHVRSPMLSVNRSCQPCHRFPEEEMRARVDVIQTRTRGLLDRAEAAVVDLIREIGEAKKRGATDEQLADARKLHRAAQWRADFVQSENSRGFHAPQEAARVLAESIDLARQGQLKAATAGRK